MEYIKIGYISGTHGLKGEIKIKSNFPYKGQIFKVGNNIYLNEDKVSKTINSYRSHKDFDMVFINDISSIEDALSLKGQDVYILKELITLKENEYLNEDLLGMEVYFENDFIGTVSQVEDLGLGNEIMEIIGKNRCLIPKNSHFIANVDMKFRKMTLKNVEGMV